MNASNSSALKGNLKSLVATGGVLAGAGTASQAAIVYTDVAELTVPAGSTIFFNLTTGEADTTGAFTEQFQLTFRYSTPQKPRIQGVANSGAVAGYGGGYTYASRLSGGTAIDSGLAFSSDRQLADNSNGQWDPGNQGFLGLRIDSGGIKYGWADVTYTAGSSLTLSGFAYDDSGGSIQAGAVPEPATTGALAALFAGSVAAFEARRRRKAAKQKISRPETVFEGLT